MGWLKLRRWQIFIAVCWLIPREPRAPALIKPEIQHGELDFGSGVSAPLTLPGLSSRKKPPKAGTRCQEGIKLVLKPLPISEIFFWLCRCRDADASQLALGPFYSVLIGGFPPIPRILQFLPKNSRTLQPERRKCRAKSHVPGRNLLGINIAKSLAPIIRFPNAERAMKIPVQHSHAGAIHRAAKSESKDDEKLSDPSTQQRNTDDSGDARDGSGEDNHHGKSKGKVRQQRDTPSEKQRGRTS